jgi:hypothetical protein
MHMNDSQNGQTGAGGGFGGIFELVSSVLFLWLFDSLFLVLEFVLSDT